MMAMLKLLNLSKAVKSQDRLVVGALALATALCFVPLLAPFLP